MRRHLGSMVSALVDGQLDEETAGRAWEHVLACHECHALVEREQWVKRRLASMTSTGEGPAREPSPELLGSLRHLRASERSWWEAHEAEERRRSRRRAGMAVVGAGSVSAALVGLTVISGAPISFGPDRTPASSIGRSGGTTAPTNAVVAPAADVHGRLPGWRLVSDGSSRARTVGRTPPPPGAGLP